MLNIEECDIAKAIYILARLGMKSDKIMQFAKEYSKTWNMPIDRITFNACLKAGYQDRKEFLPTISH